ncbi:MAG: phloretin hydrolase [Selenomonadaceae bacterium]|nr:phloretin hydrolase [Selenomonadaceae bacterium]
MNLFSGKKVGVSAEEKNLPYYKFYKRAPAAIPAEKISLLDAPSEIEIVPFEERNKFLRGDDKNFCQVGYGVTAEGAGFCCNETFMFNVTGEMLDWWFGWHSVGSDLRYKIWDAEDHYFARADNVEYVCNPAVPINQKTWGVNHYILEDIGNGAEFLKLQFKRPRDFGLDESIIGSAECQSLVCAIGDGNCAAAMVHKWYLCEGGVKFCSRFWIGYGIVGGEIICTLPAGVKVPLEVPRGLFAHNIKEFSNLAAILPEVYEMNKNNF